MDSYGSNILGSSKVLLDQSTRRSGESNIGSFLADAMVDHVSLLEDSFYVDSFNYYCYFQYVRFAEEGSWTYAAIAIINSGCIRTSILPGSKALLLIVYVLNIVIFFFVDITINDLVTAQPFENTIDVGELSGRIIKEFLEYSVTPSVIRRYQFHEFLQVSGKSKTRRFT